MSISTWKALRKRIEIKEPVGGIQDRPSTDVLSQFASELSFGLPQDYKDFVKVFGAGEIGGYFNVFAPGYPDKPSGSIGGLIELVHRNDIQETLVQTYKDAEFVKRMLPFADTIGGDLIVWDPADVRDSLEDEYGIYVLPDDNNGAIVNCCVLKFSGLRFQAASCCIPSTNFLPAMSGMIFSCPLRRRHRF